MSRWLWVVMVYVLVVIAPTIARAGGIHVRSASALYDPDTGALDLSMTFDGYQYSSAETPHPLAVLRVSTGSKESTRVYLWSPPGDAAEASVSLAYDAGITKKITIEYCRALEFLAKPVADPSIAVVSSEADEEELAAAAKLLRKHLEKLVSARVISDTRLRQIKTYLKLNGDTPAATGSSVDGVADAALVYSWESRKVPAGVTMQYRWRLYPTQLDWTNWDTSTTATFTYIPIGIHIFEVEVEATCTKACETTDLPTMRDQLTVDTTYVAPATTKGGPQVATLNGPITPYKNQRALLIGVTDYSGSKFDSLGFVAEDVKQMTTVLGERGVTAKTLVKKTLTSSEITTAIDAFVDASKDGDLVIVYLSGHGFPASNSDDDHAYFAGSDCDAAHAASTCVSLNAVKDSMTKVITRAKDQPRHMVLIIDACASGRVVVAKGFSPESAIGTGRAVHVLTAGTRNELANTDKAGTMSVFTHYLVDGLRGQADMLDDNVVTLSELMVWVRWKVAKETKGAQTPAFARVEGSGEAMFDLGN